ncbi:MAG: TolC family protein [Acidobacteriota bacterium]
MPLCYGTLLILAVMLANGAAGDVEAPVKKTLSLDEALQAALQHHPRLRRAMDQIAAAESRTRQARSSYYPQIDAGGLAKQGLSGSANLFGLHGLASSPEPRDMAASINVYQDILDFGRTRHAAAARTYELEFLVENARAEKGLVVRDLRVSYFDALKARRSVLVAEKRLEEKNLLVRKAEAFHRAQLQSKLELEKARVDLAQAELELLGTGSALQRAMARLRNAMGVESDEAALELVDDAAPARQPGALPELLSESLQLHPRIRGLDAQIRAGEQWVLKAKKERLPKIMGILSAGWTRFSDLSLGKLLFGGIGIKLPVFTGGYHKEQIEQAKKEVALAKGLRQEVVLTIRLEAETAYRTLTDALKSHEVGLQLIRHQELDLKLVQAQRRAELVDAAALLRAEAALLSAESRYAGSLYDSRIRQAELLFALGRE